MELVLAPPPSWPVCVGLVVDVVSVEEEEEGSVEVEDDVGGAVLIVGGMDSYLFVFG